MHDELLRGQLRHIATAISVSNGSFRGYQRGNL